MNNSHFRLDDAPDQLAPEKTKREQAPIPWAKSLLPASIFPRVVILSRAKNLCRAPSQAAGFSLRCSHGVPPFGGIHGSETGTLSACFAPRSELSLQLPIQSGAKHWLRDSGSA